MIRPGLEERGTAMSLNGTETIRHFARRLRSLEIRHGYKEKRLCESVISCRGTKCH